MTRFVRHGLPALVVLAGVLAMTFGSEDARWEGGGAILSAGLAIWLINVLYRIGARGDRERDAEEAAREHFDRHGRWPDEPE